MSDTSQGDGWWQASDGKWYAPEQHPDYKPAPPPPPPDAPPPPTGDAVDMNDGGGGLLDKAKSAASAAQEKVGGLQDKADDMARRADERLHGAGEYSISEDGRNGSVRFEPGRLVRTVKKRIGKDDVQTIPVKAITSVQVDRKMVGKPVVTIATGAVSYEWKMARGEDFKTELDGVMYE